MGRGGGRGWNPISNYEIDKEDAGWPLNYLDKILGLFQEIFLFFHKQFDRGLQRNQTSRKLLLTQTAHFKYSLIFMFHLEATIPL